jgi:hypothetical protein
VEENEMTGGLYMMTLIGMLATNTLPSWELTIIEQVSQEYKLTPYETCLLVAIRKEENGDAGHYFGVGSDDSNHPAHKYADDPDKTKNYRLQAEWTAGSIKKRFRPNNDLLAFANRWCPANGESWYKNVKAMMKEMTK